MSEDQDKSFGRLHDMTRAGWGHAAMPLGDVETDTWSVHSTPRVKVGDYLALPAQNGEVCVRRIVECKPCVDPPDQAMVKLRKVTKDEEAFAARAWVAQ